MASKTGIFTGDPTNPYLAVDLDDDTTTKYYGFTRPDGAWYIQRETTSGGDTLFRYVKGANGYELNWTNRATLTYNYPEHVFDTV